jgi:hypothetical protein
MAATEEAYCEESRLSRILSDSELALWHANLAERSELTADIYARRLDRFCEEFRRTPKDLASLDPKGAYKMLIDAVQHYRGRNLRGSTIKGYVKPVISWLAHNDVTLTKKVYVDGANSTPTLRGEKTPEPYELHSVWRFCDERQAAAIALEAFAGFRPQVLGNYRATDGLLISDLPEMEADNGSKKINFKLTPPRVIVREELSKEGNQYEGFLCEEGCTRLAKHLEKRMQLGETLGPESAIIAEDLGEGRVLTTKSMYEIVKTPFRHAGLSWRPYILRRYFATRMSQAAGKPEVGLLESWITFWMGHHGDVEATYRVKKELSESLLDQMREAYRRASEMLQTTGLHRETNSQVRREFRAEAFISAGYSDGEIKSLDLDKMTTEEFRELIRKRLKLNAVGEAPTKPRQLIVKACDARKYINTSASEWRVATTLANGDVVIEQLR